jgi:circadian clock protein KaiC
VVIDSLNGYHAAMPEEQFLILHMHELISYLNRQGVVTIMTMAQHGLIGDMRMPADLTYLSDTILMLRYFEARGQVRRAISAVKKRGGAHERTIREYHIGPDGIRIGAPLENLQGVFQGVPSFVGRQDVLTNSDET